MRLYGEGLASNNGDMQPILQIYDRCDHAYII